MGAGQVLGPASCFHYDRKIWSCGHSYCIYRVAMQPSHEENSPVNYLSEISWILVCTFQLSGVWEVGGQIYYGFSILSSGSFGFKLQAIPSHVVH